MKTGKNSPPLRHIEAEDKFQIDINYVEHRKHREYEATSG